MGNYVQFKLIGDVPLVINCNRIYSFFPIRKFWSQKCICKTVFIKMGLNLILTCGIHTTLQHGLLTKTSSALPLCSGATHMPRKAIVFRWIRITEKSEVCLAPVKRSKRESASSPAQYVLFIGGKHNFPNLHNIFDSFSRSRTKFKNEHHVL